MPKSKFGSQSLITASRKGQQIRRCCLTWLGVQTNAGKTTAVAHWLASAWAPKWAKRYAIESLQHTDYHGQHKQRETGYATIEVRYFGKDGGTNIVRRGQPHP